MRNLFEALLRVAKYIAYGMVWLACFGAIFLFAAAFVGDPIIERPIYIFIAIYTIAVLGVFFIWLWVSVR